MKDYDPSKVTVWVGDTEIKSFDIEKLDIVYEGGMKLLKLAGKDIFTLDSVNTNDRKLRYEIELLISRIRAMLYTRGISEIHFKLGG